MKNVYHFNERKAIEKQAREWLVKFDSDLPPTQKGIETLREWCARSPLHKKELIRLSAFWNEADLLTKLAIPLQQSEKQYEKPSHEQPSPPLSSFYKVALTAGLLLVIAIPLVYQFTDPSSRETDNIYKTRVGEQLTRTLKDGSIVQLNTNSKLTIDYGEHSRKIHLLNGEAHFNVAPDAHRPFEVYAGQGMVRAIGTAFSVYLMEDDVKITVTEGIVDLLAMSNNHPAAITTPVNRVTSNPDGENNQPGLKRLGTLKSGQIATFGKTIKLVENLTNAELEHELTWRQGFLVFNSTPLDQVIEEINRYSTINIEITDPELKSFKLGGRFKVGELEALFDVLENNLGIQVSRLDDQYVQLSSPENK